VDAAGVRGDLTSAASGKKRRREVKILFCFTSFVGGKRREVESRIDAVAAYDSAYKGAKRMRLVPPTRTNRKVKRESRRREDQIIGVIARAV